MVIISEASSKNGRFADVSELARFGNCFEVDFEARISVWQKTVKSVDEETEREERKRDGIEEMHDRNTSSVKHYDNFSARFYY